MAESVWNELTENLLSDMRTHVRNLQERVVEAGDVLEQSQGVNEKISVMREYKDETNTVNSCFRSKDRPGLVRSLQQENRQILALQEENRQMKLALEDVQRGMSLIMDKHRKAVRNFERSNALFELVQRRYDLSQKNNIFEKRFYELVDFVDGIFKKMADQHAQDVEQYSAVCAENVYLRQALISKGVNVPTINLSSLTHDSPSLPLKANGTEENVTVEISSNNEIVESDGAALILDEKQNSFKNNTSTHSILSESVQAAGKLSNSHTNGNSKQQEM